MHARPHLTYANVIATLALFIALGGSGYAATQLSRNSVGTRQLKANAVTGSKVRDDSLTGADINEASLATDVAVSYKTATATAPASSAANAATATCDSGQQVVAGGVKLDPPNVGLVNDSFPDSNNTAWTARVGNASNGSSATSVNFTVYAICTTASGR
ncbi:MAG TPA: hypothetical protein VE570_10000 [Thermoleophilaceae bacterium]|nr:hypothetical protein [Thermoleophilaceae bacterium]